MPDGLSGQFRVQWARKKYFASPFGTRCYSCAFYQCKLHTRPRVQRASGVPHALFGARELMQGLGRIARRGRKRVSRHHCERSEAIHSSFTRRDGLLRFARNDGAGDGLLRGACHRACIRATRWLAMTVSCDYRATPPAVVARQRVGRMAALRSTTTKCTRGRGCHGHPAFPTPSLGGKFK